MYQNVKRDVSSVHAIKVYRGIRGIAPPILTLALDGSECSTLRPGRIIPGTNPRYTLNKSLGGPQSRSGPFRKRPPRFTFKHNDCKIILFMFPWKYSYFAFTATPSKYHIQCTVLWPLVFPICQQIRKISALLTKTM